MSHLQTQAEHVFMVASVGFMEKALIQVTNQVQGDDWSISQTETSCGDLCSLVDSDIVSNVSNNKRENLFDSFFFLSFVDIEIYL